MKFHKAEAFLQDLEDESKVEAFPAAGASDHANRGWRGSAFYVNDLNVFFPIIAAPDYSTEES